VPLSLAVDEIDLVSILDQIVSTKRQEIEQAKSHLPLRELRAALRDAPPVRDFFEALRDGTSIRLIAEIKRASPSQGLIRPDFDPVAIATDYEQAGAACLSVLTDVKHFQGSLDYLRQVRLQSRIPVLRKDFILDEYQLVEARAAGADAVLLIAECLDDCQLRKLHNETLELGMTPLIELYEPENLPRVLEAGATLIGINNRNLRTFEVDLEHTLRLRPAVPSDCLLVAESGVHTRADVLRLEHAGVDAMLVGESLMRQRDIQAAVRALLGTAP
jgi:indole-3-glycerol phosphate synthase